MDTDFFRRPSDAVANCPKLGQSQRGVEEGVLRVVG